MSASHCERAAPPPAPLSRTRRPDRAAADGSRSALLAERALRGARRVGLPCEPRRRRVHLVRQTALQHRAREAAHMGAPYACHSALPHALEPDNPASCHYSHSQPPFLFGANHTACGIPPHIRALGSALGLASAAMGCVSMLIIRKLGSAEPAAVVAMVNSRHPSCSARGRLPRDGRPAVPCAAWESEWQLDLSLTAPSLLPRRRSIRARSCWLLGRWPLASPSRLCGRARTTR